MEFRETLLAAQRNQQQKSSGSCYYKARFDPPKKEQKQRDRLSANIQKFLVKKEEEEKQKKLEAQKKRDELQALRDPKALRKIQKSLKVFKSANKSVLEDALDRDNTAITLEGTDLADQDDYGYESQEAAAIYEKMMLKYSKIPDEPKFPTGNHSVKRDLNGTRERVKHALQHEEDPVPHKRRRRGENGERDLSPPTPYEPEKKVESKPDKPKFKKPAPPPMDFNQLLKLAEQKKSEPLDAIQKKAATEADSKERLMTKKQKREYEEEMARRQRRQERIDAEKAGGRRVQKEEKPVERVRKPENNNPSGFGRIPKLGDKNTNNGPRPSADREKMERMRMEKQNEKDRPRVEKGKSEHEKEKLDRERLDRLKAERERIDRDIERLNKDRDRLDKTKTKIESSRSDKIMKPVDRSVDKSKLNSRDNVKQDVKKNIDLKSQNTYRIDKNSNEKKITMPSKSGDSKYMNGHSSQGKPVPKLNKEQGSQKFGARDKVPMSNKVINRDGSPRVENGKVTSLQKGVPSKRPDDRRLATAGAKTQGQPGPSKNLTNSFDFDKHVNAFKKNGNDNRNGVRPGDGKRRPHPDDMKKKQKRRALDSESDYDSEMDDFIDDGDENMDYSTHIKEIFGYDRSKYRDMDDDDDPDMESSFARQQREEYISKKIGIMEDLEDMRMEAMEKKKSKKVRRISDD